MTAARAFAAVAVAAAVAVPAARARADAPDWFQASGYVQPQVGVRHRGDAVPRDQWEYGAESTRVGVMFEGAPLPRWSYTLHLVVGPGAIDSLSGDDAADAGSDPSRDPMIEQATVTGYATEWLAFSAGQLRIPLTLEHQSPNTALMFPNRSAPNQALLLGPELGALASLRLAGDRVHVATGLFNGTGVDDGGGERGVLYAARVDVNPLGAFPIGESHVHGGPLRLGLGAGVSYYPSSGYGDAGFPTEQSRDLRGAVSMRLAARGFYLQTEAFRRQRTDSLSHRPLIATGAYAQASRYVAVRPSWGVAPIGRVGWTAQDQGFDPRDMLWVEAGATLYLRAAERDPDSLKITLEYLGEYRRTEGENAHGAVAQLQLRW
jgi:hypothetical protein